MYNFFYNFIKTIFLSFFVFICISNYCFIYADDIDEENDENINFDIEVSSNIGNNISSINSRSYVVLDRLTETVLVNKNENNKVKMASTTKIMTSIVVLENAKLGDMVEISKKAANTGGSRLGLHTGDKISILNLLYGLMLCSGNDAAVALAESVGGDINSFSDLMNKKAKELGLNNSHFESPHGLDSDEHYTTAYELALLTNYALQNKTFSDIVGTKNITIDINGVPKSIHNTNELLGNLNGVYGVKTGFTNGANRCLVTACKRGDLDIICVVLGADTKKFRTQDSIKLIEYTFNNYKYINIEKIINDEFKNWQNENPNYLNIIKGITNNINLAVSNLKTPVIPIKKDSINFIQTSIEIKKELHAPINKENSIGNIKVTINENELLNLDIISSSNIERKNILYYFYYFVTSQCDILENNIFE